MGAGASNDSEVVDDGNFWRFAWLLLSERLDIRPTILLVASQLQ